MSSVCSPVGIEYGVKLTPNSQLITHIRRAKMPRCQRQVCSGITITTGKSNLTTGRIAAARGQLMVFARCRQCAFLPNICFFGLTRVQIPNGISIGSAIFAQLITVSRYFTIGPLFHPQNCPFPWGIWTPIYYMVPLANPRPKPKRHLDRFSRFCRAHYCDRPGQTTPLGL